MSSWEQEYYGSLTLHNQGTCSKDVTTCRHCRRAAEVAERFRLAREYSVNLGFMLRSLCCKEIYLDYNGGGDEGYVDYATFICDDDSKKEVRLYELDKDTSLSTPMKSAAKLGSKVAWNILGHGFGVGDFSCSGTISVTSKGEIYHNKELV